MFKMLNSTILNGVGKVETVFERPYTGRVDPAFNREHTVSEWRGAVELFCCVLYLTHFLRNFSAFN